MKFLFAAFFAYFAFFAPSAKAQSTVNLSWTLSVNDNTPDCAAAGVCHQTMYRAAGACSATSTWVSIASLTATQTTYSDTAVPSGTWCYGVSFSDAGGESTKDTLTVSLPPPKPAAPTGLKRI